MGLNSRKIIESNNIKYTLEETCPCCGRYTPNGEICNICLEEDNKEKSEPNCGTTLPIEDQIEILKDAILSTTVATDREAYNEAYEVVHYLNRKGIEITYK